MRPEAQTRWDQRYTESPGSWTEPDDFLKHVYDEFLAKVEPGKAMDLAGGAGRNSLFLVERGWQVNLIDGSEVGLGLAREKALGLVPLEYPPAHPGAPAVHIGSLETEVVDLDHASDLGIERYDAIMVFYFLKRELFPAIVRALKPGGFLIYRTYTIDRMKVPGGPDDPNYHLQPNELLHAFTSSMRILHYHETLEGKAAAELLGRKP
jgi:tellurite methyltransferase